MADHTQSFQVVKAVVLGIPVPVVDVEQTPVLIQAHPAVLARPSTHFLVIPGNGRPVPRVPRGTWGYYWRVRCPTVFFRFRFRPRPRNHPEEFQKDSARKNKEVDGNQHPHNREEDVEQRFQGLLTPPRDRDVHYLRRWERLCFLAGKGCNDRTFGVFTVPARHHFIARAIRL